SRPTRIVPLGSAYTDEGSRGEPSTSSGRARPSGHRSTATVFEVPKSTPSAYPAPAMERVYAAQRPARRGVAPSARGAGLLDPALQLGYEGEIGHGARIGRVLSVVQLQTRHSVEDGDLPACEVVPARLDPGQPEVGEARPGPDRLPARERVGLD